MELGYSERTEETYERVEVGELEDGKPGAQNARSHRPKLRRDREDGCP